MHGYLTRPLANNLRLLSIHDILPNVFSRRLFTKLFFLGVICSLALSAKAQEFAEIPTPKDFFGFPMGADRQLAHWDEMLTQNSRIARPRQRYTGPGDRDVPAVDER